MANRTYFIDSFGVVYFYDTWADNCTSGEYPSWLVGSDVQDVNDLTPEEFWEIYGPSE